MKSSHIFLGLLLGGSCIANAFADRGALLGPVPAKVEQECASCHIVYPPAMLPQASWQRLFAGLDKHFGTDASLDAKTRKEVGDWFMAQGGTYRRVNPQERPLQDRITQTAWFTRKHREIAQAVWSRPSIKSASNCTACHGQGASKGVFEDDFVSIPK